LLSADCSLNYLESVGSYHTDARVVGCLFRSPDDPIAHTTNNLDQQLVLLWITRFSVVTR